MRNEKRRSVLNPKVLERMKIPDMILNLSPGLATYVDCVTDDRDISYWHDLKPKQGFGFCREYIHEVRCIAIEYAKVLKMAFRVLQQLSDQGDISNEALKENNLELIRLENDLFNLRSLMTKVHPDKIAVDIAFSKSGRTTMSQAVLDEFAWWRWSTWPYQIDQSLHAETCRCSGEGSTKTQKLIEITYGARSQTDPRCRQRQVWCPITKDFIDSRYTRLRLIPVLTVQNEIDLGHLLGLGNSPSTLWSGFRGPSSAIILTRGIATAIQTFQAVLIPTDDDEAGNYQFVILDEALRQCCMKLWTSTVSDVTIDNWDKRKLEWFNGHRPSATNMYYHYLITRMLRKRYRAKGWESDAEKVHFGQTWSVKTQLRRDVMYEIAFELGDLSYEAFDMKQSSIVLERPNMLSDDGGRLAPEEASNMAVRIVDCCNDALRAEWMWSSSDVPAGLM